MPPKYDVILLGLGGMGSAAAYHLSCRGKRVLGLERFGPAHNQGSSHGDSRIIRQAYHEHPDYVPLVQRAYQLWHQLEHDAGVALLHTTGGLMLGRPASSIVQGAMLSATEHQIPHQVLNATEIHRRYPALHPRPDDIAVYEASAGYLLPETAIHTHLQLAARQGADLHFHEPVIEWSAHPSGAGVTVQTEVATYHAERLVIAPGAWASGLLTDLEIPFDVRRLVMCWFQPIAHPELFQPAHFPIYLWDVDGQSIFYGIGVKAAMHSAPTRCTPQSIDRTIHDADVSEVRSYLQAFIPDLNGPLERAVTCMYTLTPDQHFVVGLHPNHPQVSIAAGFSGHGFKFTSVMGEILADLAIYGHTAHPIGFLSHDRLQNV
jgi:sarcosine oxidase